MVRPPPRPRLRTAAASNSAVPASWSAAREVCQYLAVFRDRNLRRVRVTRIYGTSWQNRGVSEQRPLFYGPEVWRTDEGREWTYWDLWFAVVCHTDYRGDWDAMEEALAEKGRPVGSDAAEAKWSHLRDVRSRLEAAGLTAAELTILGGRGNLSRARTRVIKTDPQHRDRSPAMRDRPSVRQDRRMLYGRWPSFPVSPQLAYDQLESRLEVTERYRGERATVALSHLFAESMAYLEKTAVGPAGLLAVRRAGLTLGYQAAETSDDSCGTLGWMLQDLVAEYCAMPWRETGLASGVYWRDLLELWTGLCNYGLTGKDDAELLRTAGAGQDLDLADTIVSELHAEYLHTRRRWHASTFLGLRASLRTAAGGR